VFTVNLSASPTQTVTVNYATANGTASAGSDYTAASGTLTFVPGEQSKTIAILVSGDTAVEPDETFTVGLSGASGATIGTGSATGTIVNDDVVVPSISISNTSVTEGNTANVTATFTVQLSAATTRTVTVNWATSAGTATADVDYVSANGTVTFPAGTTTQTISVTVRPDTLDENNETFTVTLSNPGNGTIGTATATGTILDNDATPSIVINNVQTSEGNSGTKLLTFTLTLSAASGRNVSVNFTTANSSATATSDYVARSGTASFALGSTTTTVAITINGDTTVEGNETFFVNLSGPVNATIADTQGIGTILNDD
jgi:hypothetical protein